MRKTLTL